MLVINFSKFCTENYLKINVNKTKVLQVNMDAKIYCNGAQLENVNEFRYLGLIINNAN